jgi:general secretion pathway protein A
MAGPEVLRVILRDFGLVSRDEIRRGSLTRADAPHLLDTLEGFLRSLVPLDARAVVIVDEAQSLSPEALDQVRMLGAYEENGQRLLQIVLCGQPGLLNTLKTDPLRALNERITRRAGLSPLLAPEVEAYVRHRLSVAGAESATVFTPEALGLVSEYSRGLPRRINVLCDRALDEGKRIGSPNVSAEILKRAAKSLASPSTAVPVMHAAEATAAIQQASAPVAAAPVAPPAATRTPTRLVVSPAPVAEPEPEPEPVIVEEEDAPVGGGLSPALLGIAGVVLLAVLGTAYYGWSVASSPVDLPTVKAHPASTGAPATAKPAPSDDQVKEFLNGSKSADPAAGAGSL